MLQLPTEEIKQFVFGTQEHQRLFFSNLFATPYLEVLCTHNMFQKRVEAINSFIAGNIQKKFHFFSSSRDVRVWFSSDLLKKNNFGSEIRLNDHRWANRKYFSVRNRIKVTVSTNIPIRSFLNLLFLYFLFQETGSGFPCSRFDARKGFYRHHSCPLFGEFKKNKNYFISFRLVFWQLHGKCLVDRCRWFYSLLRWDSIQKSTTSITLMFSDGWSNTPSPMVIRHHRYNPDIPNYYLFCKLFQLGLDRRFCCWYYQVINIWLRSSTPRSQLRLSSVRSDFSISFLLLTEQQFNSKFWTPLLQFKRFSTTTSVRL